MDYIQDTFSRNEYISGIKRESDRRIVEQIRRLIIADDIKEKSPEWYLLMQLKTMVHEDRS